MSLYACQCEAQGRVYDAVFHPRQGYDPRVSRDDKAVNLTLNIYKEVRLEAPGAML